MKWQSSPGFACAIALFPVVAGCGNSSSSGDGGSDASSRDTGPAIDELAPIDVAAPSKRVVDLSSGEQLLLCDWNAREFGGYGMSIPCLDDSGNPGLAAPASRQDCVSTYQVAHWGRDCPLTVQDFMACVAWQVDNVCNVYNLPPPPECVTLDGPQCIGAIDSDATANTEASGSTTDSSLNDGEAGADATSTPDDAGIDAADAASMDAPPNAAADGSTE
jgi:hypothetical protein